ncbi:MAG: hypothetical protein IPL65_14115 [Lewinellaceae bacterium]|nr:hypothetical protein [Lewinellaceae bacterium]
MKKTKTFLLSIYCLFLLFLLGGSSALTAQPCTLVSGNINLGGPAHDLGYQSNDLDQTTASLSNGNFVVAWETRDGVDGDGNGAFFQVFKEDGEVVTGVIMPYADINPAGTGDQGAFGPKIVALNSGFAIAWESENGPGDTGPVNDDQQDVCFRVYNNNGAPVSATTRVSVDEQEDHLEYILPQSTGGFVVLLRIDEDVIGNNTDDYFYQAFNSSGVSTSGALKNISGTAHDLAFQATDPGHPMADLGNGIFVVSWEAREDIDGNGTGAFFRIFNSNGTPVTGVIMPYADINPMGTGDQGTPGPIVSRLANGNFVVGWESQQGPGDGGPLPDDQQDVYFRIYSPTGTPVTGTTKANSDNTADEEHLDGIVQLTGGNFALLYHRDEDDTGNTDDYFVRTFTPGGMAAGASVEISGGAHTNVYCTVKTNKGLAALTNGNFVVGWSAWDAVDGDGEGIYYRVFNAMGAAVSQVSIPYADTNPMGTGNQSTTGPVLESLPEGFTIAWESEQGPGDFGPAPNGQQDVYHRVIDNSGVALCGTTKTNAGNDAEEEILVAVQALNNGNFAVVYRDDEDATGNHDDFFVRVIGGAPLLNVCPTVGTATVSTPGVCVGDPFTLTVSGLQNMAMSANNEKDYGIRFMTFANATSDPYSGGTPIGSVAFANLTGGGTTATLAGVTSNTATPNLFIYAILDAVPGDLSCMPYAQTSIAIHALPMVSISLPDTIFVMNSMPPVNVAGGGLPVGGVYTDMYQETEDDGNGLTFSFPQ